MLSEFKQYYKKAKMNQERLYEGYSWNKDDIDDDLIWHVPIYDVVNRKFAAFSSFLEALRKKEDDPKQNGKYFKHHNISDVHFMFLCYLFRLCGSGINYKPKTDTPFNTHGFGNFWIVDLIRRGKYTSAEWLDNIPINKFSDVKGYLLPMIPGGLRSFILEHSYILFHHLYTYMHDLEIYELVDIGNEYLQELGYKKQNFVLTAFAMDMAEYFPNKVKRNSKVYIGSNAIKCLKQIYPKIKGIGSNLTVTNVLLDDLCEITGNHSYKYDMEDVACDFIRYKNNFQSVHHIKLNNGIKYYNNVFK